MPLDESAAKLASTQAYGGSDSTAPSFNRPIYVRHASRHGPKDLGEHRELDLRISGEIGSESGSQSLFLRFRTSEEAHIGLRGICLNRYTDQYISFSLKDGAGSPLTLEELTGESLANAFGIADLEDKIPGIDIGYVLCGYWASGFAEQDCATARPPATSAEGLGLSASLYYAPIGGRLPGGDYEVVITTCEWAKLPFKLQLVVAPSPVLASQGEIRLPASGRFSLNPVSGSASMAMLASGRLAASYSLEGKADASLPASGTIEQASPYAP